MFNKVKTLYGTSSLKKLKKLLTVELLKSILNETKKRRL